MVRECFVALFLMMNIGYTQADFLGNNLKLCYILDGVLILYGVILTVLYCKLRMQPVVTDKDSEKPDPPAGIYQDLGPHREDTYETIKVDKH